MPLRALAPEASVSTNSTTSAIFSDQFGARSEHAEQVSRFFFERSFVSIFPMMPGIVAVGLAFLIEMKIDDKIPVLCFDIRVKTRIAGPSERTDEALLLALGALEGVTSPT